jgi:hypothetical protein
VIASRYGTHVDDQWSVDEVPDLARTHRREAAVTG